MSKIKTVSAIGLDIGSYSIKCVEVLRSGTSIQLNRASILPLADSSPATLAATLKLILNLPPQSPLRGLRISVSGSSLLIRRISMPAMTSAELKSAIRFEAEGHIPFPIDDCVLDFQIINQEETKKTMNVLLVAAKKDFIQDRIKVLSDLNLQPEIIDVDIFCLINAFEMLGELPTQEHAYGLLNIGHKGSSFAIMQGNVPFFVREIPFGGLSISKALAEIRGIKEDEADTLKSSRDEAHLAQLKAATQKGFEPLIEELKHSLDYYENEAGEELRSIRLSGGGALAYGATDVLAEELGKQIILWDNTKKMKIFGDIDLKFLSEHSSELNVALGMVLRGLGHNK